MKKVPIEIYEKTEKIVYDDITKTEDFIDDVNKATESLASSAFVELMSDKFNVEKPKPINVPALTHADVIHASVLLGKLITGIDPNTTIKVQTLQDVWYIMCQNDGVDLRL